MERLEIAVCEDENEARACLRTLVENSGVPARVTEFDQGRTFLTAFHDGAFDLIFMDIFLGDLSGVEAVRRVRAADREIPIAFTTVSPDFALDGYRLDVAKYIEKPVSQKEVDSMLALAREHRARRESTAVTLGGRRSAISPIRLRYAEQQGHYLLLHMEGGAVARIRGRLDELAPQLTGFPFFRCHKSFLCNLAYVAGLDREQMIFRMRGGDSVYIRRENLRQAREAWENWLFSRARERGPDE